MWVFGIELSTEIKEQNGFGDKSGSSPLSPAGNAAEAPPRGSPLKCGVEYVWSVTDDCGCLSESLLAENRCECSDRQAKDLGTDWCNVHQSVTSLGWYLLLCYNLSIRGHQISPRYLPGLPADPHTLLDQIILKIFLHFASFNPYSSGTERMARPRRQYGAPFRSTVVVYHCFLQTLHVVTAVLRGWGLQRLPGLPAEKHHWVVGEVGSVTLTYRKRVLVQFTFDFSLFNIIPAEPKMLQII